MNAEPNPLPATAGDPESNRPLFPVLNDFWEALRRGDDTDPDLWLHTHPDGREGLRDLTVLTALHDARQMLLEDSGWEEQDPERGPAEGEGVAARQFLEPGTRLGECRIEGLLGCGGMGEVYLAEHEALGRKVAVKVLPARLASDPDAVQRFRKSVQILAKLNPHANIAHALHASQQDGRYYLVMEYVPGDDLKMHARRSGPLSIDLACSLIRQAALGLDYAHEHGVVHRDIKPSNLMLTPDGTVKILDLGLARLMTADAPAADASQTHAGALVGTLDYIAPEQAQNAKSADARSDLYSLGCTFYYLLAGRPPFEHRLHIEKLMAHALEAPEDIRNLRPEVPAAVAGVVHRLLAKRLEDRYPSARSLIEALDGVTGSDALNRNKIRASAGAIRAFAPRRKWMLALAAVFLPGVSAVGLHWAIRSRENTTISDIPGAWVAPNPVLQHLGFFVQREHGGLDERKLVLQGAESTAARSAPLRPKDAFHLAGAFREPTHWYLLWFDTRGEVAVAAQSQGQQTAVELSPDAEKPFVTVSSEDPEGVHLLLLVAGSLPEAANLLKTRLRDVGKPPFEEVPQVGGGLLRGGGEPVPANAPFARMYEREIEKRLPPGLVAVYAHYIETAK